LFGNHVFDIPNKVRSYKIQMERRRDYLRRMAIQRATFSRLINEAET